jgi:hypothetical protein
MGQEEMIETIETKLARHKATRRRTVIRGRLLAASDRADERIEELRAKAERDALLGKVANLQDTVVSPTPEWERHGPTEAYTPRGRDNTIKTVTTVRRRMFDAVKHLEARGALDDQQAFACRWFRDIYETAQIEQSAGISSYGETIRGDIIFGHLPTSEWGAQARRDYREAQSVLPSSTEAAFSKVSIDNMPIKDAARSIRRGKGIALMMVRDAASALAAWLQKRADEARREASNAS